MACWWAGAWLGVGLGLLALFRVVPRLCFLLSTLLYLSYASACRGFLAFQWDNLLLEVGLLAALLPAASPGAAGAPAAAGDNVQALLSIWPGQVAIPRGRLAGWQRHALLLRDRAAADRAGFLRPPAAGGLAQAGELGGAVGRVAAPVRHVRRAAAPAGGCRHPERVPVDEPDHRELRLLLLPGAGPARVPVRRSAGPARAGRAARPLAGPIARAVHPSLPAHRTGAHRDVRALARAAARGLVARAGAGRPGRAPRCLADGGAGAVRAAGPLAGPSVAADQLVRAIARWSTATTCSPP